MAATIGIATPGLWALRDDIGAALDVTPVRVTGRPPANLDGLAGPRAGGWPERAARWGIPYHAVTPGPLPGVRPGLPERPLSLSIGGYGRAGHREAEDAAAAHLALWRRLRLSGRNDGRDMLPDALVGQDFAIVVAGDDPHATKASLRAAREARPGAPIAFLTDGGTTRTPHEAAGLVDATGINPHALFDRADLCVAPEASRLGIEARLAGVPGPDGIVADLPTRIALFERYYLDDVVYFDPWRRRPIPFAEAAEALAFLRDRLMENDRPTVCVGVSGWKREVTSVFLDGPDGPPSFEASPTVAASRAAEVHGRVVAWETRMPAALPAACRAVGVPLLRMEDGFLRSVGLGAAFRPGASAVIDTRGIYYDPRQPSDLETILAETDFASDLLARAAALRQAIVSLRLSKYNVGVPSDLAGLPRDRPIVLVPGQVEDDASVRFGSPVVRTNLALIEAARKAAPDAYLIFKPHPDVEAGLRQGRVPEPEARRHADIVLTDVSIADLLDRVDAVETMTSLTGFEALLRGKRVGAQGQPFYAGWGLTDDRHPPPRRRRKLALDELVAGALILYPRYLDPVSGLRCTPELLVERLAEARDAAASEPAAKTRGRALYVRLRHALLGPLALALRRSRGAAPRSGAVAHTPEKPSA